jgi:predicted nucleic acid-binding protein
MLLPDIDVLLLALRWSDSDRAAAVADWVEDVRLRAADVPDAWYASLALDPGATFVTRQGVRPVRRLARLGPPRWLGWVT